MMTDQYEVTFVRLTFGEPQKVDALSPWGCSVKRKSTSYAPVLRHRFCELQPTQLRVRPGAGGLGAPAAMYLAAAGVGTIGIADADEVDLSNLQRQIIHQTADVGKAKVQSAKETINAMNPDVTVNTYREFITSDNIMDIIKDYDFVIDETDNFPAKFLINDACVMAKKPFSHAGIIRFKGQLMTYVPGEGPCYRCVFKNPPPRMQYLHASKLVLSELWVVLSEAFRLWKQSSIYLV